MDRRRPRVKSHSFLVELDGEVYFGGDVGGGRALQNYWHERTGVVAQHAVTWAELPVGWRDCGEADAPVACACDVLDCK